MHRIATILKTLTIMFVVAGALLWLLPPRLPDASAPPLAVGWRARNASASRTPSDSSSVAAIIASNIFSASRAAPRSRYSPPGAGGAEPAPAGAQPDPSASLLSPPPRVFGTMMGPGGATALMQADSAGASGRLYREGDRVGTYRILKISARSVIVSGPGGRVELRIQPREDRTQ